MNAMAQTSQTTDTWTGGDGDWFNGADWSIGYSPTASNIVSLQSGNATFITVTYDPFTDSKPLANSVASLSSSSLVSLMVLSGELIVTNGGNLSLSGPLTVGPIYNPSGTPGPVAFELAGGTLTLAGTVDNEATIVVGGNGSADLILAGELTNDFGKLEIGAGGTLDVTSSQPITGGETFDFLGGLGTLEVASILKFNAPIVGYSAGSSIILTGFQYSAGDSFTYQGTSAQGHLVLYSAGAPIGAFNFRGNYTAANFQLSAAPGSSPFAGALEISMPCFASGTRIATPDGEVPVEALREGDLVVTHAGKVRPVVWIGHTHLDFRHHARPEAVRPIRIAPHTFGPGRPARTLVLSPGHALFLHGVLVDVEKLVNGVTIVQDRGIGSVTYFHVELEEHDVLIAEGMPAESYLDTGNRHQFMNDGNIVALHGDIGRGSKAAAACYPVVESGPIVAAIRARLIADIEASNFRLEETPELRLRVGQRLLLPVESDGMRFWFELPPGDSDVYVQSRVWTPGGVWATDEDMRRLGVRVDRITRYTRRGASAIMLDDPALGTGFYGVERDEDGHISRWTNGEALLPRPLLTGAYALEIVLAASGLYWARPAARPARRLSA